MSGAARDQVVGQFLISHGFQLVDAIPLAQDASFRRYLRLTGGAVLMDAPPPEDTGPFIRVAAHLASVGLSVPQIIAADQVAGLVLEEDLGDNLLSSILTEANAVELFDTAIDALVAMHRSAPPAGLPAWGKQEMMRTALGTLFDWWWPAMHGTPAPTDAQDEIGAALDTLLDPVASDSRGFVHRDFFAGNLIWLPDRIGLRRMGIIDFQSAAIGHPAYDLVSLLQDARRHIPIGWEERALARYLVARPELDPARFRAALSACAAQRHLRVACQWVRLAIRDGRDQYLIHGPRTWDLLTRALSEPAAAPLAAALNRWIPIEQRRNPPASVK